MIDVSKFSLVHLFDGYKHHVKNQNLQMNLLGIHP